MHGLVVCASLVTETRSTQKHGSTSMYQSYRNVPCPLVRLRKAVNTLDLYRREIHNETSNPVYRPLCRKKIKILLTSALLRRSFMLTNTSHTTSIFIEFVENLHVQIDIIMKRRRTVAALAKNVQISKSCLRLDISVSHHELLCPL
jgi:hypothetical protein